MNVGFAWRRPDLIALMTLKYACAPNLELIALVLAIGQQAIQAFRDDVIIRPPTVATGWCGTIGPSTVLDPRVRTSFSRA